MWQRYVAIGDSTVEGLDDPGEDGVYRGWADRLAERIDHAYPGLLYANLGIRGKRVADVRAEQVPAALALNPDLVLAVAGLNDVLRPSPDLADLAANIDALFGDLVASGATVATFTMPDPEPVMPLARLARRGLSALDAATRAAAERHGVVLVDLAAHPVASDPRLWSEDRLHANSVGHERIAAALAAALDVPGSDHNWHQALPAAPPLRRPAMVTAELAWLRRHFAPWVMRRIQGRSSGDGITAKRPELLPVRWQLSLGEPSPLADGLHLADGEALKDTGGPHA